MAEETNIESVADNPVESIADEDPIEASQNASEQPQDGQEATTTDDAKVEPEKEQEGQNTEKEAEPEDYTLEAGEGFNVPAESLKSFQDVCKAQKLTKAQAEALLDWHRQYAGDVDKLQAQQEKQTIQDWQKQILDDPEIGGQNWKASVADCRRVLARYDTDGSMRKLLKETHADYNPVVVRCLARMGKAMREDRFVTSKGRGSSSVPLEDRLWPDMQA